MALRIVCDENMAGAREYLGKIGGVRLVNGRALQRDDLKNVDALLVRSVTQVNEALLSETPVKFVGTATSGFDHIDTKYLADAGIAFAHAPGSNANSVVEYVLSAIASIDFKLEQLCAGGTAGIIGFGHIGKMLATRYEDLGIGVKVYDPWLDETDISHPASLAEILQCDVISVHAELTHAKPWPSFHLLGAQELSQLGAKTLLINASRGAIVDNAALLMRLQQENPPLVILDVWEHEPVVNPALLAKVTYGTAHIAGYSMDGKRLATRMLGESLVNALGMPAQTSTRTLAASVPKITIDHNASGTNLLRALLHHNYDITVDDRLLRDAVIADKPQHSAANFDRLRKHYRCRAELHGSTIKLPTVGELDRLMITALGCKVISPC